MIKWIKRLFSKNKKAKFYWFDTVTHHISEIDYSVTGSDGNPAPPMDCVRVKEGTKITIYKSRCRNTEYVCIGGRALPEDAKLGLHSQSDFDDDNYTLIRRITANSVIDGKLSTISGKE